MANDISTLLLFKLREQVERTEHLMSLIPPGEFEWAPHLPFVNQPNVFQLNELLCHLTECLKGFCAALYANHSGRLAHFVQLREMQADASAGIQESRMRLRLYMAHVEEGFTLITDDDLRCEIPTVFAPQGEALLTILLGNLEHYINHKYQLFFYLKMLGLPLKTHDLYHLTSKVPGQTES